VRAIDTLSEAPEKGWLPVRVDFDVRGVGRWQYEHSICMPLSATLEEIRHRQAALS
jgi:hypothetical protein